MYTTEALLDLPDRLKPPNEIARLSKDHYAEIVEGSGVDPRLLAGTFQTVTAEDAKALGFSDKQARAGWVTQMVTPDGEAFYQLKPDTPRVVLKNGKYRPVKYETPARHDNHVGTLVGMVPYLRQVEEPFWIVEGAKKAASLITQGILALVLTGVWNWGKKRGKYSRPELLPDWDDIPLEGRKVYICFDADFREKRGVGLAMKGLAERLTERGAHVYLIWLPGPEKGIDDRIVAGGDVWQLQEEASPYQAGDLTPYIATKDRAVRDAVAAVDKRMSSDTWHSKAAKTDHSLLRAHLEIALERGQVDGSDVVYRVGMRELQERAAIGSNRTIGRSHARLDERDYLSYEPGDAPKGIPNRYRLRIMDKVHQVIGGEGLVSAPFHKPGAHRPSFVPHLRWSAPPPPEDEIARLVGSQLPHLGKVKELALVILVRWGGEASLRDLAGVCGWANVANFKGRHLEELAELGVIELPSKWTRLEDVWVRLTPEWRKKLDERREMGGELSAWRRQVVKHHNERTKYRNPTRAEETPETMGRERWEQVKEERRHDDEESQLNEQRRKVGMTAEVFVHDKLAELGRMRLGLLKDVWTDMGGNRRHIWPAVKKLRYRMERLREYDNALFVFPPKEARRAVVVEGMS